MDQETPTDQAKLDPMSWRAPTFGHRVFAYLIRQVVDFGFGGSQRKLAKELGVSFQAVSNWQKGRFTPGKKHLSHLAKLLERHGILNDSLGKLMYYKNCILKDAPIEPLSLPLSVFDDYDPTLLKNLSQAREYARVAAGYHEQKEALAPQFGLTHEQLDNFLEGGGLRPLTVWCLCQHLQSLPSSAFQNPGIIDKSSGMSMWHLSSEDPKTLIDRDVKNILSNIGVSGDSDRPDLRDVDKNDKYSPELDDTLSEEEYSFIKAIRCEAWEDIIEVATQKIRQRRKSKEMLPQSSHPNRG